MKWPMVKLGDCCQIISGSTPKTFNDEYWNGDILWATPKDLTPLRSPYISDTPDKITKIGFASCSTRLLPVNSVLFSSRAPIGLIAINTKPMCTNQGFKSFIPGNNIDVLYLYYCLKNMKDYIASRGTGTTFKEISKETISNIEIPVPSLIEQKKIAAVFQQADFVLERRRQAIARLDQLGQSLFLDLFGDPITNTMGWERLSMDKIGTVVTGNTPSRKIEEYFCGDLEWIKSDNINTPFHYLTKSKETLSPKGREVARVVPPGSILVTCIAGSKSCIGNVAMTDREVSFNQQINGIVPNYKLVTQLFLYAHIIIGKKLIQRASTNGMKGMVSKSAFEKIEMIVPPIDLQKKFSKAFDKIIKLQERNTLQNDHLVNLSNSLMNEYFGE